MKEHQQDLSIPPSTPWCGGIADSHPFTLSHFSLSPCLRSDLGVKHSHTN